MNNSVTLLLLCEDCKSLLQVVIQPYGQGECSSSLVTLVPWCLGALVLTRLHRWCPVMLLTIPHSLLSTPHRRLRTFPQPPFFLLLLVLLPSPVHSHARLMEPPSRASMWRLGFDNPPDFNDHQVSKLLKLNRNQILLLPKGFCGGFNHQYGRMGGRCGICGDPADAWPRQHEVNFYHFSLLPFLCCPFSIRPPPPSLIFQRAFLLTKFTFTMYIVGSRRSVCQWIDHKRISVR